MRSAMTFPSRSGGTSVKKVLLVLLSLVLMFWNTPAHAGAWVQKASIPTARVGAAACVVDGKIFLLGGYHATGVQYALNELYDPVTDSWQEKQPMPTARGFLSAAVVGGTIYAIGGGYPGTKATVEAYDPVTDTWTTKASLPTTRLGAHAVAVDGIIYNIGGNYNERNCEAYDPATDTWTAKSPMPESGGVVSVSVYNDLIYIYCLIAGSYVQSRKMLLLK